jgi:hypothetical protein
MDQTSPNNSMQRLGGRQLCRSERGQNEVVTLVREVLRVTAVQFFVAGCQPTEMLEAIEKSFDAIAFPVNLFVKGTF